MGNKIGRRRRVVDENYTRPQGLYQHRDVDHKKLRKLILDSKLAPCYPGDEDCALDLEECPICFLYYPSLNRSRCCTKGICTECFLQMKPLHSNRSMQCPFCKTTNYAVEYRGVKTKEEKGMEQVEEQRVIEAQIRMRQQELQDEEERMQERQEINSSSRIMSPAEVENRDISSTSHSVPSLSYPTQGDEVLCFQGLCSVSGSRRPSGLRQNREDNFDMDLEDILVMEAIWLSIQDNETQRNRTIGCSNLPERSSLEDSYNSHVIALVEASPSGGLACAAAALAEHQHMNADSATIASSSGSLVYSMLRQSSSSPAGEGRSVGSYPPESCTEVSPGSEKAFLRQEGEWGMDQGSEVAQARTSYASSDLAVDVGTAPLSLMESVNMAAGHFLPESFEEQMMLAMAISLAEARARTACSQGLTWL